MSGMRLSDLHSLKKLLTYLLTYLNVACNSVQR